MLDYGLEVLVLLDEIDCNLWADALDWVDVIAAEKNAEINELLCGQRAAANNVK